nr:hypothetical protein [uncultured Campylobacter sp.]
MSPPVNSRQNLKLSLMMKFQTRLVAILRLKGVWNFTSPAHACLI